MNLWLSLNKAFTLYGEKTAILDGDVRYTYSRMAERIAGLMRTFQSFGLQPGDVVAILAPNCHQYTETYYACGISGIVLCPLNYRLASRELATILKDAGVKVLIAHSDFTDQVSEAIDSYDAARAIIWLGKGTPPPVSAPCHQYEECVRDGDLAIFDNVPSWPADQLAQLYYTSGTTGRPKGVMLTQGNVTFNALAVIADINLQDTDVWLHAAPLFHLADAWATFSITWVGGTHVFIPYFCAEQALEAIEKERVTHTVLVPTMLNSMLNEQDNSARKYDCSSWRLVVTGGSPIAPEMVRRAVKEFGCEYIQLYGMTESSPFLTLSRLKGEQTSLSGEQQLAVRCKTGRPYIGAEVRVVRADGAEVAKNDLEVGEIIARGPTVFAGYWNQPEVTAQTLKNGWLHTGDLATIDSAGFINIVDRAKDMIITGGENVYSTEVEFALVEHPGVLECAVFGVPDQHWGESVKAVVVRRQHHENIVEAELIAFLRERLAHYKVPRSIDFASELPKTGSGKIYKKALRETFWRDLQKQVN